MLTINVKHNIAEMAARLAAQQKQVTFAAAVALTRTAQAVKADLLGEMQRVFDRPTPYTMNAVCIQSATKARLQARVWLKSKFDTTKGTGADEYLGPQIFGGERKLKRFESSLDQRYLLPRGYVAVPGAAAKLDAYGNMQRSQIVQILSALKAFGEQGYVANRSRASEKRKKNAPQFFVGRPAPRLPLGVWQRFDFAHGSAVKPVIIFVKKPRYGVRFKFFDVGNATIARELDAQLERALREAMASARDIPLALSSAQRSMEGQRAWRAAP